MPKPEAVPSPQSMQVDSDQPVRKKQRTASSTGDVAMESSPRKSSVVDSNASPPSHGQNTTATNSKSRFHTLQHQSITPNSTNSWTTQTTNFDPSQFSALADPTNALNTFDFSNWDRGQPTTQPQYNPSVGSAVYATPQDLAFAQSSMNMNLPGMAQTGTAGTSKTRGNDAGQNMGSLSEYSDPMFWGNMDYNVTDIFGSASWENMTGPFAPGGAGGWEM